MLETLFAGFVLAVCVALLLRLALGERYRARLDAVALRTALRVRYGVRSAVQWPASRRRARKAAREAIERARRREGWDGNVYRSDSFKRERKDH